MRVSTNASTIRALSPPINTVARTLLGHYIPVRELIPWCEIDIEEETSVLRRIALAVLIAGLATQAHAFDAKDVQKLRKTGECERCDLVGADRAA